MASSQEAEVVQSASDSAQIATLATSLTQFFIGTGLQATLSLLWGVINSLQITTKLPMIGESKFPANAMEATASLVEIATFNIIPVSSLEEQIYYFPEADPFTVNFEMAGTESKLFLANVGLPLWILALIPFLATLSACCTRLSVTNKHFDKIRHKLRAFLYEGGVSRMLIEFFFDFFFLGVLNLHTVEWNTKFDSVKASNYVSLAMITAICAILSLSTIQFLRQPSGKRAENFIELNPVLFEDKRIEKNTKKSTLIVASAAFFVQRMSFTVILILAKDYLWVQLAYINSVALAAIIFNTWHKPHKSKVDGHFENFNDVTTLLFTYHLWCFTNFVPSAETRSELGLSFIGVMFGNITVHLFRMLYNSVSLCKQDCKQRKARKRVLHKSPMQQKSAANTAKPALQRSVLLLD